MPEATTPIPDVTNPTPASERLPATSTAIIRPAVELGPYAALGEYAILGQAPGGCEAAPPTSIGTAAVIRSHSVIYAGVQIGDRFHCGHHVLVREFCEIGDDVSIGSGSVIEHRVRIGHGVRLHSNVFVPEYCDLQDGCWIGPGVVFTNARYPRSPGVQQELRGATVRPGAIVGAHATILPGIVIGPDSVVGAGSVVTHDVAPGTVVAGNPARVINQKSNLPYGAATSERPA